MPHRKVGFDANGWIPAVQRIHRRANVGVLFMQALARSFHQSLSVVGTTEVSNENDPLQVVNVHQEIELLACRLVECIVGIGREPSGTTRDGPTVVARNLQVLVAELVERLAPSAVAAIKGQRANRSWHQGSVLVKTLKGKSGASTIVSKVNSAPVVMASPLFSRCLIGVTPHWPCTPSSFMARKWLILFDRPTPPAHH